jgi:exodeoxyribonuclease VII large subunit
MPEIINDRRIFSLLEVTKSIQKTLSERYTSAFWVKAEMNKLNLYPQSGHCYPELVEKKDGKIIAEIRSNLWKDDYQRINDRFLKVLKEPLKNGISILFCAQVTFDPVYGLSLRIIDIDPSYSLGELEREKQETIEKLQKEGIYHTNRSLPMALLPKRIAIISVETSKGYSDFLKVIEGNSWGYKYFIMLFPALLQGEKAVETIINQLKAIKRIRHHFDAVAIIRGGGGDVGLTCYNHYALAREIALFPIPVITGIGHSTNETVAEMIAYKNAITPTELADFLLQKFHNYAVPVQKAQEVLIDKSKRLIKEEKLGLLNAVKYFKSVTGSMFIKTNNDIQNEYKKLVYQTTGFIKSQNLVIDHIQRHVDLMDPVNVLKRGYSITSVNGKVVKRPEDVKEGDELRTTLAEGSIISTVKQIDKSL